MVRVTTIRWRPCYGECALTAAKPQQAGRFAAFPCLPRSVGAWSGKGRPRPANRPYGAVGIGGHRTPGAAAGGSSWSPGATAYPLARADPSVLPRDCERSLGWGPVPPQSASPPGCFNGGKQGLSADRGNLPRCRRILATRDTGSPRHFACLALLSPRGGPGGTDRGSASCRPGSRP